MITDDYIEVYKLAKEKGIDRQNLYRWIREGKVKVEDVKMVMVSKQKMFIRKDAELPELKIRK